MRFGDWQECTSGQLEGASRDTQITRRIFSREEAGGPGWVEG
jgi:hypothetical protein